jgi:acyl-CoA synthetase (AMP-forming)/AMP-acid ligase II
MLDYKKILSEGTYLKSSGTSGDPKEFFQSPQKLLAASQIAIKVQGITSSSKIYTCCKITHAGGLLAQTLPGLIVGATVNVEVFNAYEFVKQITQYTHSHITPLHAKAIMLTKNFQNLNLTGVTITCGADPVTWDIIESFVEKGCTFIVNWGMSEIGPMAINSTFTSIEQVLEEKRNAPSNSTILGSNSYCDFKIIDNELYVRGDICIYDDWYATGDTVIQNSNGTLYYTGRKNLAVDLNVPKKG